MKNYKILVLSDLKNSAENTLKNAISLSKMIGGAIDFFHVKKPTDVVEKENQLSAMRSINDDYTSTRKKIQKLLESISHDYNTNINSNFSFGNVKDEISKYIEENNPDIIVLGKRKSAPFQLIGDSITQFVLQKHEGVIMIASGDNVLEPNQGLSIGVLDGVEKLFNIEFANDLISHTQKPLKSFTFAQKSSTSTKVETSIETKVVEYVFEQNENSIKNLSNYVSKNNINLLCINRSKKVTGNKANTRDLISKLNVSMLVASK